MKEELTAVLNAATETDITRFLAWLAKLSKAEAVQPPAPRS